MCIRDRLYLDNLRSARATDVYTLKGGPTEVWEPRFTYHGFRYVEVTGYPGTPSLRALTGCVVHDAIESAGEFESSDALLNRIYRNIYWGKMCIRDRRESSDLKSGVAVSATCTFENSSGCTPMARISAKARRNSSGLPSRGLGRYCG